MTVMISFSLPSTTAHGSPQRYGPANFTVVRAFFDQRFEDALATRRDLSFGNSLKASSA